MAIVEDAIELKRAFFSASSEVVLEAGRMLSAALTAGGKVLAFGNGGSAADAQHFAAELVNRFQRDRPALAALALTTDSSILTSVANDASYDDVFSRQIEAFGHSGDVALAISTSGGSRNVLAAVEVCRQRRVKTIGLTGGDGGELAKRADLALVVPHRETPRIQEIHAMLVHLFCQIVEDDLYGG